MSTVERKRTPMVPPVIDPRVERGAALLDEQMPGWTNLIDLGRFDLRLDERCVLGQVGLCVYSEDYYKTVRRFLPGATGCGDDLEIEHGFFGKGTNDSEDWRLLEQDWRLAILARRTP